jgi:hypothetical protein
VLFPMELLIDLASDKQKIDLHGLCSRVLVRLANWTEYLLIAEEYHFLLKSFVKMEFIFNAIPTR